MRTVLPLIFVTAAACTSQTGTSPQSEPLEKQNFAVVTVTAEHPRFGDDVNASMALSGHVVSAEGFSRSTLDLALGLWAPELESGCRVLRVDEKNTSAASINLLDAGSLSLAGNGGSATVRPRSVPDLGSSLGGEMYVADLNEKLVYAAGEQFELRSAESKSGVPGAALVAPPPVELISINDSSLEDTDRVVVASDAEISVRYWSDAPTVFVTIEGRWPKSPRLECRFDQATGFSFGAADLDPIFGANEDLELRLRTASSTPLRAGTGSGDIDGAFVFEFADHVRIQRSRD